MLEKKETNSNKQNQYNSNTHTKRELPQENVANFVVVLVNYTLHLQEEVKIHPGIGKNFVHFPQIVRLLIK